MIKRVILGTVLSILIFFSVSFVDFLTQLPPIKAYRADLRIGKPFNYFYEFYPRGGFNHGWNIANLILDSLITWIIVTGFYILLTPKNKEHTT
ncbi:hypothetical protein NF867_13740 [Solitalea sp. MAHUQ-68]|uniref:Uncharacterized protein n=1 Tax=Solitalea agri TaxID=2953739 RepID=A0A9X2F3D9_9SPHI|nr:hypothetical protein [Solitalea agri]MCO4293922.1 hypothetical protein [Solitalea agri]